MTRSSDRGAEGIRRLPRSSRRRRTTVLTVVVSFAASAVMALYKRGQTYWTALGETTMMVALLLFGLAWIAYLRSDAVRILPPRRTRDHASASWTDRVPRLGSAPPFPPPLPGSSGPDEPAYAQLVQAEENLKDRILGISNNPGVDGSEARRMGISVAKTAVLAGLFLLVLSIVLQYLVPQMLHR